MIWVWIRMYPSSDKKVLTWIHSNTSCQKVMIFQEKSSLKTLDLTQEKFMIFAGELSKVMEQILRIYRQVRTQFKRLRTLVTVKVQTWTCSLSQRHWHLHMEEATELRSCFKSQQINQRKSSHKSREWISPEKRIFRKTKFSTIISKDHQSNKVNYPTG